MAVGLLELDHVSERYRAMGTDDYRGLFEKLLGVELRAYDVIAGELPDAADECDGWIATGSRHSVYEDLAWISAAAELVRDIRDAELPFVGVCFGHQLLAWALGGTVERAGSGWGVGVRTLEIVRSEPWMEPPAPRLRLHHMHQDQVTAMPEGGVVLACADHCEIAMFQVGDRMVGMQAHPEFTVAYAKALIDDRVERIGTELATEALASLDDPTDEAVAAQWMAAFLGRASSGLGGGT